ALGAPPRRVLLRPTAAGAVCVGASLEPDRADEGLRRARELRSRGTRPPRLVGAGPHAAVRPVRAGVDGARARPRARSRGTAEVRRAPPARAVSAALRFLGGDRKSTRLNSSHQIISYAVFLLKKKNKTNMIDKRTYMENYP